MPLPADTSAFRSTPPSRPCNGAWQSFRQTSPVPAQTTRHARSAHGNWRAAREALIAELEQVEAVAEAAATDRTFASLWNSHAPTFPHCSEHSRARPAVRSASTSCGLRRMASARAAAQPTRGGEVRVTLVRFLDLPRSGTLDPTRTDGARCLALDRAARWSGTSPTGALNSPHHLSSAGASTPGRRRYATSQAFPSQEAILFGLPSARLRRGQAGHALAGLRGGADAVEPLLLSLALRATSCSGCCRNSRQ